MNKELVSSMELGEANNECVICLDELRDEEICKISEIYLQKECECKYYLHKECLKDWINMHEKNSCLMCKEGIILKETCSKKCCRLLCLKRIQKKIFKILYTMAVFAVMCYFLYLIITMFTVDYQEYDKIKN